MPCMFVRYMLWATAFLQEHLMEFIRQLITVRAGWPPTRGLPMVRCISVHCTRRATACLWGQVPEFIEQPTAGRVGYPPTKACRDLIHWMSQRCRPWAAACSQECIRGVGFTNQPTMDRPG